MKQIEVTRRTAAELIGRAYLENEFLNTTQLNVIKSEFDSPTFDYGAPGSLWELYNWTSYSLKNDHPANWLQDHLDLHTFYMGYAESLEEDYYEDTSIIIPSTEDKR